MPTTPLTFEPPSPGAWELERTHLSRPLSMLMEEIFPAHMMKGFAESTRHYGVLLDHIEAVSINRFPYMCPRPVGAPKSAKGPPPRLMFEILRRVHPELRRRIKRSEDVFRDRVWRAELKRWNDEVKPSIVSEAKALAAEDIASYDTPRLTDHVRRAVDFAGRTVYWHHRFNVCVMLPTGDFLAHTQRWTGLTTSEILGALRGSSPASAGAVEELATLRRAVLADSDAHALLLSSQSPAAILDGLRARPAPVGPAAAAYLDTIGLRIMGGYDLADAHAKEHPELLVKIIRTALTQDDVGRRVNAEHAIARVRERVPSDQRTLFDELLQDAQATYRVRDERIFYGDGLGAGLARRAVLEAGRRLHQQNRIADPTHLVDARSAEIVSLLETGQGPSAAELAERVRFRLETPLDSAPARLGFPPSPPPPADWLPPAAARTARAFEILMAGMFTAKESQDKGRTFKGFSASPGTVEGPARVVMNTNELPLVQPGEILVAKATAPTFNVVLPLVTGIVTERGGALSHAAIVAREYGLPAVVGCVGVTGAIRSGMRVRVDGDRGEVTVVD